MMRLPVISKKSFVIILVSLFAVLAAVPLLFFPRLQDEKALAYARRGSRARLSGFPRLFLWAWERPEQLEFINPREVGVAFLAKTIYLSDERVTARPRMQPLRVPTGTVLIAVVRVETVREARPSLSDKQRAELVSGLIEAAQLPNVRALQIDFDALESERPFYKSLLEDVRARLPEEMPLSMTALASWCIYDNWLDNLPVDEAVPMLFSMGLDDRRVKSYLKEGGDFRSALCRSSTGISTDEQASFAPASRRTYVFNTRAWTQDSLRPLIERIKNENPAP
jgi:hypothetical protein